VQRFNSRRGAEARVLTDIWMKDEKYSRKCNEMKPGQCNSPGQARDPRVRESQRQQQHLALDQPTVAAGYIRPMYQQELRLKTLLNRAWDLTAKPSVNARKRRRPFLTQSPAHSAEPQGGAVQVPVRTTTRTDSPNDRSIYLLARAMPASLSPEKGPN
jgi:hypothetical protein